MGPGSPVSLSSPVVVSLSPVPLSPVSLPAELLASEPSSSSMATTSS